jgi:predicted MPP superfamily phosphohydrolase
VADCRWLDVGINHPLHVREERLSTQPDACRLLYVSDIHLRSRRSARLTRQVVDVAAGCAPDAVLLGGDLLDLGSELTRLRDLVGTLRDIAPVLAVGGNHDRRIGFDAVRAAVVRGGGRWIHSSVTHVRHRGRVIAIAGPEAAGPVGGHVRILCAHDPRIWRTRRYAGYHLVLAGHLHGCQLVACHYRDRLLPGAFFYPHCVLRRDVGMSRLVVSRGVSDLLPIRWKCPREVVLCHV